MILNIELKGYGKASKKVCDSCPCYSADELSSRCGMGHWKPVGYDYHNGVANTITGEVVVGKDEGYARNEGWLGTYIRPQICIDKHGE